MYLGDAIGQQYELLLSVSLFCAALENKISMRFLPKEEARFFHYPHYTLL
jgi:hypothetical protein